MSGPYGFWLGFNVALGFFAGESPWRWVNALMAVLMVICWAIAKRRA
jgi:hypothetical protein